LERGLPIPESTEWGCKEEDDEVLPDSLLAPLWITLVPCGVGKLDSEETTTPGLEPEQFISPISLVS